MKRYAIWNKQDPIITPSGAVFTAEQWIEKYPVAALDNITILCSYGEINGGFFGTLGQTVLMYEHQGCDFSNCTTPEEQLAAIEAFEEEQSAKIAAAAEAEVANTKLNTASLASIAAQLEYQNMMTLDDAEEV